MKVSFMSTIAGLAITTTAFHHYPDSLHSIEARELLLRRGDLLSKHAAGSSRGASSPKDGSKKGSGPDRALKEAEQKASAAREFHHGTLARMEHLEYKNLVAQANDWQAPEVSHIKSQYTINQGNWVATKQRERGDAYSAAAKAAGKANNPRREQRNSIKAESAFAGADAATKEMQYASTKAMHDATGYSPQARQKLAEQKAAYTSANERATRVRNRGGRDSDSDDDGGRPIPPMAPSVHGIGRDPVLFEKLRKQWKIGDGSDSD